MLNWTEKRARLVDLVNLLMAGNDDLSGEAYTALNNHIRGLDPELSEEITKFRRIDFHGPAERVYFPEMMVLSPERTALTAEEKEIIVHTATRAAQGLYCGDNPELLALVEKGLMECVGKKSFVPDPFYRLTKEGLKAFDEIMEERHDAEKVR